MPILGLLTLTSLRYVFQEILRRVTGPAYNPQPLSPDHIASNLDSFLFIFWKFNLKIRAMREKDKQKKRNK